MDLVNFAADNSLQGLEFASGIWGSVGGAVFGNAGAYGGEIKDVLTEVLLVDKKGNMKTVSPEYCKFGYRESYLKETEEIVLSVKIRLQKGNKDELRARIDEILAIRASKHPVKQFCAGSFFKNIEATSAATKNQAAAQYLEQAGAKNIAVGGAQVFERHANFIIKKSDTCVAQDVFDVSEKMRRVVLDAFNLSLSREVRLVGNFMGKPTDADPLFW